ncbi:hypothetical protein BCV70DRAFT_125693 [Testicularia cyperi]|uniref:Uncharacterized protein n=1 Tax=Testicularia cyperi TaxID=1882483 RepID=A0A317XMT5_9BASI|nr:hypothetical protein BCV70DRAFT_125693 [Testicularia cyperi]
MPSWPDPQARWLSCRSSSLQYWTSPVQYMYTGCCRNLKYGSLAYSPVIRRVIGLQRQPLHGSIAHSAVKLLVGSLRVCLTLSLFIRGTITGPHLPWSSISALIACLLPDPDRPVVRPASVFSRGHHRISSISECRSPKYAPGRRV